MFIMEMYSTINLMYLLCTININDFLYIFSKSKIVWLLEEWEWHLFETERVYILLIIMDLICAVSLSIKELLHIDDVIS